MALYSNDKVFVFLTGPEGVHFIRHMRSMHKHVWQDGLDGVALYSKEGVKVAQWADIDRSKPSDLMSNRLVNDHYLAVKAEAIRTYSPSLLPSTKETLPYVTSKKRGPR